MKTFTYLLAIGITFTFISCQRKDVNKRKDVNTIDNISFTYGGSIKNVNVLMGRTYFKKNAYVSVYSEPFDENSKSKIDTTFYISINSFNKLSRLMASLEKIDIDKAFKRGLDGYSYKVEYGAKGKNQNYIFWCPNSDTEKRGLTDFINVSNEILKTANLKKENLFKD